MKKRLREMTWDDYGISRHRYKELQAFCLQYDEKKSKINRDVGGMSYDGMPRGSSKGDSLEKNAIQNVNYENDCKMIEQAAIAAAPDIYPYIIKSVTEGLTYEEVEYQEELGKIPMGKTDFYAHRRLFYHFLDRLKIGDKIDLLL